MAETWTLTGDVPGVGRSGDVVVYNPNNPNPRMRLSVVSPRGRGEDLEKYKEAIRGCGLYERTPTSPPRLQVVE